MREKDSAKEAGGRHLNSRLRGLSRTVLKHVRQFFILRILKPRIFESKFRDHCAKKLDGALRKSTPSFKNLLDPNSKFRDS